MYWKNNRKDEMVKQWQDRIVEMKRKNTETVNTDDVEMEKNILSQRKITMLSQELSASRAT